MPISHDKKLIFIHIPKNAGTSVFDAYNMSDFGHHEPQYYMLRYPNEWRIYKKMAIVRNPWDRVVSCYEYARMEDSYHHGKNNRFGYGPHPDYEILKDKTFEECLQLLKEGKLKHQGWAPQHIYTHINGQLVLDEIGKFENITKSLIKVNTSTRKDYKSYYNSDELINLVKDIYKRDIELFEFKYD